MHKAIKVVLFFSILVSFHANAEKIYSTINQLGAASETYAIMVVDTPLSTKPSCAEQNTILSFDKSTSHGKDMYALAMAAITAQLKLRIEYSDTECGFLGIRTLVNRIDIYAK